MKKPHDGLINELKHQIRLMERVRPAREDVISTGLAALDELFPQKGMAAGTLTEWLSVSEGGGAAMLTLVLAGRWQAQGGAVAVIDDARAFYPPAAKLLGLSLEQTLVLRPGTARDALWAWEQILRSSAVAVALGWVDSLNDRVFRRLQLAAETGGSVGFLLRPAAFRHEPSWAESRFLVTALPSAGPGSAPRRRLHVETLHGRGGGGGGVELELRDEAGVVRLVSPVAHSTAAARAART